MFRLNTERTYPYPVSVTVIDRDGREQQGEFQAVFRVVPTSTLRDPDNAERHLLDLALVDVRDLELVDSDGNVLQGQALIDAVKDDPSLSAACVAAWRESVLKKTPGPS